VPIHNVAECTVRFIRFQIRSSSIVGSGSNGDEIGSVGNISIVGDGEVGKSAVRFIGHFVDDEYDPTIKRVDFDGDALCSKSTMPARGIHNARSRLSEH
jgi:hypothetical protein